MNSFWMLLDETNIDNEKTFDFLNGINVYITRPHILNQKVSAIDILEECTNVTITTELLKYLEDDFDVKEIKEILIKGDACFTTQESQACDETMDVSNFTKNRIIFRSLVPRQLNIFQEVLEAVVLNHEEVSVAFYPKRSDVLKSRITPAFPYKITHVKSSSTIKLEVLQYSNEDIRYTESMDWLKSKVFHKVVKWSQEIPKKPVIPSIKLLSAKEYNVNLHYLKSKYGKNFVEIWPKYNKTDAIKYVYEDIAIAAYLITLWNQERQELQLPDKQTFVDLGCGNGLLVHILTSEGHEGLGIDLRRRKIWDAYGPNTNLIEKVIEPNDKQRYPKYDWIIGNHADELTPWIPVIASRSSYKMKAFLIPCCFYSFDGKYERIHAKETQYQSYLKFLHSLCTTMGFKTEIDKLRIPSTKRTCIVCTSRNYSRQNEPEIDRQRKKFIDLHLKGPKFSPDNENYFAISTWTGNEPTEEKPDTAWVPNFVPREPVEKVQNCSKLNKDMISSIIKKVFDYLLAATSTEALQDSEQNFCWNKGGSITMKDLCSLLGAEVLKCMKTQNGGVQTFFRNHSFIFEVKDNEVRLKVPCSITASNIESAQVKRKTKKRKVNKPIELRKRNCFFHFNHPQGCPLPFNECTFSHEDVER